MYRKFFRRFDLDSITNEEKDLLNKLLKDDNFFYEFLSTKEKVNFWMYRILKKIGIK